MDIFYLSGTSNSDGLEILMGDALLSPAHLYLNPDTDATPPLQNARAIAAMLWQPLSISWRQAPHIRAKAFFEDATGPGFSLPGCNLCVSDHARIELTPYLKDQATFLPINIRGAPQTYWVLYVTRYYDKIDLSNSKVRIPSAYISDRRLELREPAFYESEELSQLHVFRVRGTSEYVPFALGDFATEKFRSLVSAIGLGGFSFMRATATARRMAVGEPPVLMSKGKRYSV